MAPLGRIVGLVRMVRMVGSRCPTVMMWRLLMTIILVLSTSRGWAISVGSISTARAAVALWIAWRMLISPTFFDVALASQGCIGSINSNHNV